MGVVKSGILTAALVGSTAFGFGFDDIAISGDAKLFYSTDDSEYTDSSGETQSSLFDQNSSVGQSSVRLSMDANISEATKARLTVYGISTLGMDRNLVSHVWEGGFNSNLWIGELFASYKIGETTGKIGRVELDTPLIYTERWSIVPNTFESVVLSNQDIPDTTLIGTYVGASNGAGLVKGTGDTFAGVTVSSDVKADPDVPNNPYQDFSTDSRSNTFKPFYDGAFALGAINNSWKPLTVAAWYYTLTHTTKAYWASGDLDIDGFQAGFQYAGINISDATKATLALKNPAITKNRGNAFAGKLGYAMGDTFSVYAAASYTTEGSTLVGTNLGGSFKSNLYTGMFWNYGTITQAGTTSYKLYADYNVAGLFDIGAQAVQANTKVSGLPDEMMLEATIWGNYTYRAVDLGFAYVNNTVDNGAEGAGSNQSDYHNMVQLFLTLNF